MTLSVASLHIYPIKSLGGFKVNEARLTDRGFEHDRRWMLVNEGGRFISQREAAAMACLHCSPLENGFRVTDTRDGDTIELPWVINEGEVTNVTVWDDELIALRAPVEVSAWFCRKLNIHASLAFMPDAVRRNVNPTYAQGLTALTDGFPYLIISQASLDDLNARMAQPLPMDRFRPNVVISGGGPFQEDAWKELAIGDARFSLVKPCVRCAITTTDQHTGERGKEPLRTLATYRRRDNGVDFGMNAMAVNGSVVCVGDLVIAPMDRDEDI